MRRTENLVMFISENLRECMYSYMYMPKNFLSSDGENRTKSPFSIKIASNQLQKFENSILFGVEVYFRFLS